MGHFTSWLENRNFLKPADMGSPGFSCAKQIVPKTFENFKVVCGDEYIQVYRSIFKHSDEHLCLKAMHYLLFCKNSWGLQVTDKWQPWGDKPLFFYTSGKSK